MYNEDDLLPLSGLQHLLFCERQWGLIHLEQVWEENRLTVEGRVLHEHAHSGGVENRPGIRISRGLRIHSFRLGLSGEADVVEFRPSPDGIALPGDGRGLWRPYPVEYKRGKRKQNACDEVQLCAQALCLEEMFGAELVEGSLFYGEPRRRTKVPFTPQLRARTEALALRMHALHRAGRTPVASHQEKCESCSLLHRCLPKLFSKPASVQKYLDRALDHE